MTAEIRLTCLAHPWTQRLLRGPFSASGFRIVSRQARSTGEATGRMLALETDAAEMSLATYVLARERGYPLIALPLFPARRFLRAHVWCRAESGIDQPEKLRGRAVGLPQFWMTSSVWHRGILRDLHGVAPREIAWWTAAPERIPQVGLPRGVALHRDPTASGLEELLSDGRVDCVMLPSTPAWARARGEWLRPLFGDGAREDRDGFAKTGIHPIAHVVAMREALWREDPRSARALGAAFAAARRGSPDTGEPDRSGAQLGPDGLDASRPALETFLRYLAEEGGCRPSLRPDELFADTGSLLDG